MGVVLFFSIALFIFLAGITILALTFFNWLKTRQAESETPPDSLERLKIFQ